MFKAIIEHFHGPGFDGPYEHVVAYRLQAISAGSSLGKWPGDDGIKGKEGPELSLASFVFTEVVQREVRAQRINRVNLRTAKAVHSSSQRNQALIAEMDAAAATAKTEQTPAMRPGGAGAGGGPATLGRARQRRSQPASAPLQRSRMLRMRLERSTEFDPVQAFCTVFPHTLRGVHYGSPSSRKRHCHLRQTPPRELGEERLPELAASSGGSNCISWAT